MKKLALTLLGLSFLAACSQGGNSTNNRDLQQDAGIVGGSVAQIRDFGQRSVVSLRLASNDSIFCTGTLIAPRVVLTAGHCFKLSGLGAGDVTIGFAAAPDERRATDEVRVNENFSISAKRHIFSTDINLIGDVALVRMTADAPAAAIAAQLPKAAVQVGKTVAVRIYGYGLTSSKNSVVDGVLRRVDKLATVEAKRPTILMDDERDGHGTCNGDSGGPAFLAISGVQVPTVVALVSNTLGMPGFLGVISVGDRCKQKNGLTQIGSYVDWIKKNKAELLQN